jgi:hypothetical protein
MEKDYGEWLMEDQKPMLGDKLPKWQTGDDRAMALIGSGNSNTHINHLDWTKFNKEVWESLEFFFGSKAHNAKFFLKQLFGFNMSNS